MDFLLLIVSRSGEFGLSEIHKQWNLKIIFKFLCRLEISSKLN